MTRRLSNSEIAERLEKIEVLLEAHNDELAWYRFLWRVLKLAGAAVLLVLTLKWGDIPSYIHKSVVSIMSP